MPRNNPNYKVARDALMRNFERELNFDENLLAGIYTVKQNSLNVKCKYLCSIQYICVLYICLLIKEQFEQLCMSRRHM